MRFKGLEKRKSYLKELRDNDDEQQSWTSESVALEKSMRVNKTRGRGRTRTPRKGAGQPSDSSSDKSPQGHAERGRRRERSPSNERTLSHRKRRYFLSRTKMGVFFPLWLLRSMYKNAAPKDRPKVKKPWEHKGEKGALVEWPVKIPIPSGAAEIFDCAEDGVDDDATLCKKSRMSKSCAQQLK